MSPGKPSEAKSEIPISPQKVGIARRRPPNSFKPVSPPLRLASSAKNQNSAAAVTPWLNTCSITPVSAAALAVPGLLMTAVFLLTLVERVFSGPLHDRWSGMPDLSLAERCMIAPAIVLMFVVGLYPQLISGILQGAVLSLVRY
jgi:hypothetical protein